jgi:hypothetical protein
MPSQAGELTDAHGVMMWQVDEQVCPGVEREREVEKKNNLGKNMKKMNYLKF